MPYPVSVAPGRAVAYAPKLALWFVQLPRLQRKSGTKSGAAFVWWEGVDSRLGRTRIENSGCPLFCRRSKPPTCAIFQIACLPSNPPSLHQEKPHPK